MKKPVDTDFLKTLKDGVQSVLQDATAKPSEKIAALVAGSKILAVENKLKPEPGDDNGSFFNKRRKRSSS